VYDVLLPLIPQLAAGVGSIAGLIKDIKNPQLQRELANLNKQLAVAESHEADMIREITSLRADLLEEQENPLTFTGVVYYDTHNTPYCPGCYGESKHTKRIPLSLE
jgi:endonuclease/exonuclease/phosphatase (EEP) superfamily protein YafD